MSKNLRSMYLEINEDHFPKDLEISFTQDGQRQSLVYEKVTWNIGGEERGLRYGENPDQEAAMYKLVNGNLALAGVDTVQAGQYLASNAELLQSGKHPGKINLTDVDAALNILRYLDQKPCTVIVKHNNPSGVAWGNTLEESFIKAYHADRIAAFGGAVACNRTLDKATAEAICTNYVEVVAAPDFEPGVLELFASKKNLRVVRIRNMSRLTSYVGKRFLDWKSMMDGGLIVQWSYHPVTQSVEDLFPAYAEKDGKRYEINRKPSAQELSDMLFGWLVEAGVTSNSVIYVKDGVTVGIGTGEQDRVGVAEIARDKAYKKFADLLCFKKTGIPLANCTDQSILDEVWSETKNLHGGLTGSVMVSDAFFPFRDGVDVGLKEGVRAVVQPGGSLRDYEVIEACNECNATMMFTGQRSFKH